MIKEKKYKLFLKANGKRKKSSNLLFIIVNEFHHRIRQWNERSYAIWIAL